MANHQARGQQRDKPFRDALRLEIAALQAKDDSRGLRKIALSLIEKAEEGDIQAIRELVDRLEGKVPQGIVGDDDGDPIRFMAISPRDRARALASLVAKAKAR